MLIGPPPPKNTTLSVLQGDILSFKMQEMSFYFVDSDMTDSFFYIALLLGDPIGGFNEEQQP